MDLKILIFNTLYAPIKVGGAEISVQALAETFYKNGHEVGVVTLGTNSERQIINGVEIFRVKIQNTFWPFEDKKHGRVKKLWWHIKDIYNTSYKTQIEEIFVNFKPQLIHTNNLAGFSVYIWKLAKTNNIQIVHTLRDYYLQCPKTTKFKNNNNCSHSCMDCRAFSTIKKKTSKYVDVVVGVSNYVLQDHLKKGYFPNAKQKVIFNGFELLKMEKEVKKFGKNDLIKIGYIGQIKNAKGIDLLIGALEELTEKENWLLYIAGKTNVDKENEYISKLGDKIEFLGYIDQKVFFDKIDVLVVPSLWEEPFGRVVIEGLMNKKIVIGSNRGGIVELFNLNDEFLFEPTKINLHKLLEKIITFPEYLNDFKFNEKYLKQFSIDKTVESYCNTFKYLTQRTIDEN